MGGAARGRALGRAFTAAGGSACRRMHLAPASASHAHASAQLPGLLSVSQTGLGVRVLLHSPHCSSNDADADAAEEAGPAAPTRIQRAPWAADVLPLSEAHV